MKLRYIFILFAIIVGFSACDPNDTIKPYDVEYGSIGDKLPGEWYVTYSLAGADQDGYSKLMTYNGADNSTSKMWIDDLENFWGMKAYINCDPVANTFSATAADEIYNGITVDIKNGKIILGGGRTAAGNVTDSIYMEVTYSDNPTNLYIVSGIRRTGFLEDEMED